MNVKAPADEARRWREAMAPIAGLAGSIVDRVVVLNETTSTQDECRLRCGARPGMLVTTLRQTAGRGRLGRRWADDRGEGVALTLAAAAQPPERLSIASAIAVCEAAEHFANRELNIRWPNDIMASGRKLAGILIERHDDVGLIGIGINVNQTQWPAELAPIAVSLRQCAQRLFDRAEVIRSIVGRLQNTLARSDHDLTEQFAVRDGLCGKLQTFIIGRERLTGIVQRVDPLRGLLVRTSTGDVYLHAAQTSLDQSPLTPHR